MELFTLINIVIKWQSVLLKWIGVCKLNSVFYSNKSFKYVACVSLCIKNYRNVVKVCQWSRHFRHRSWFYIIEWSLKQSNNFPLCFEATEAELNRIIFETVSRRFCQLYLQGLFRWHKHNITSTHRFGNYLFPHLKAEKDFFPENFVVLLWQRRKF
jgi:hypothetical protein